MDDITLAMLASGYIRRKQWEARVFWSGSGSGTGESSASYTQYRRVPANELMQQMGAKWQ